MPLSWLPRFRRLRQTFQLWNRAAGQPAATSERWPRIARMHEHQSGEQADGPSLDGAVGAIRLLRGQRGQYARPSKPGLGGAPTGFGKTRSERARAGRATVNAVRRWPLPPTIAAP